MWAANCNVHRLAGLAHPTFLPARRRRRPWSHQPPPGARRTSAILVEENDGIFLGGCKVYGLYRLHQFHLVRLRKTSVAQAYNPHWPLSNTTVSTGL
jgi:hypothetical protein